MRIFPYRGESPPKKAVRIQFWQAVQASMGVSFFSRKFLVIPSQFAGDVATLTAMGVATHNIYGIDVNKHAVAAAARRFPGAHFAVCPFSEAIDAFPQLKNDIGCAFIDLCAPLRTNTLEQVFEIGKHTELLGYEFMCGREMGLLNASLALNPKEDPAVARLRYIQNLKQGGNYYNLTNSWSYASHSAAHFGKPMILGLGVLSKRKKVNCAVVHNVTTWETVRSRCIANPQCAQLWNVSAGTLAAWKAHESRGTYLRR